MAEAQRRALLTGAAGFVGSHLAERLLADGFEVTGIDSFTDYYPRPNKEVNLEVALAEPTFTLVEGDIVDLAADGRLTGLVSAADVVFHLAAQAGVRHSWGKSFDVYVHDNVLATQLLLEAAKSEGVDKFVYASSSSVYGDTKDLPMREEAVPKPYSPYGVSKLAAEHLCTLYHTNFGLPTVSLRLFTVYGPRQRPDMAFHRFLRALIEGLPLEMYGDGSQTREFTYISDIVRGFVLALDAPDGSVVNLGGGSSVSLTQAVKTMEHVSGLRADVRREPAKPGDVSDTEASHERSRTIGYEPVVSLEEGLRQEFLWMEKALPRLGRV